MEAAASTGNRKRPRFPAAAWKTLRVSHSSHSPRPVCHQRHAALMPLMPSAILSAPHLTWPHFNRSRLAGFQRPVRASRHWRTRKDPFEAVWPTILGWLEAEPDQTARELLVRLQQAHDECFPDRQLRTLQRRVKQWRSTRARELVFGDQALAHAREVQGGFATASVESTSAGSSLVVAPLPLD